MECVSSFTPSNYNSLFHDEFSSVVEYIADLQALSSLMRVSKTIHKLVVDFQGNRLRAYFLAYELRRIDKDLFRYSTPEHPQSTMTRALNKNFRSILLAESPNLVREGFSTRVLKIDSLFMDRYLYYCNTLNSSLLGRLFTHLKEEMIDALSFQPPQALSSILPLSYPQSLASSEYDSLFELSDIVKKSQKRTTGELVVISNPHMVSVTVSAEHLPQVRFGTALSSSPSRVRGTKEEEESIASFLKQISPSIVADLLIGKRNGDVLTYQAGDCTVRLRTSGIHPETHKSELDKEFIYLLDSLSASNLSYERKREIVDEVLERNFAELEKKALLAESIQKRSCIAGTSNDIAFDYGRQQVEGLHLEELKDDFTDYEIDLVDEDLEEVHFTLAEKENEN